MQQEEEEEEEEVEEEAIEAEEKFEKFFKILRSLIHTASALFFWCLCRKCFSSGDLEIEYIPNIQVYIYKTNCIYRVSDISMPQTIGSI